MKARLLLGSVATLAALAVTACKDDTALYPGGPAGSAVTMQLNKATFVMPDGATSSIAAQVFDSAGNVAADAVTIASCNSAIVTVTDSATPPTNWGKAATVTAAGVGSSCITATANGIVDTALVTVGPATLVITGAATIASGIGVMVSPFVPDTLTQRVSVTAAGGAAGSGLPHFTYSVAGYSKGGTKLAAGSFFHQWGSVDSLLLRPWSRSGDSVFVTQPGHLGSTRLVVTAVGGATAVLTVNVVPDTFTKPGVGATITPLGTSLTAVDSVRLTRCGAVAAGCAQVNAGFGNRAFVDGVETFILPSSTATNQFVIMPPLTRTGVVVPVLEGNMATLNGAAATWEFGNTAVVIGAGSTTTTDPTDPVNDVAATATPFAAAAAMAAAKNFFGTLQGANCVDNATNPAVAGSLDCLDWFSFSNTDAVNAHPLTVTLAWLTDADVDMTLFDNTGTGTPLSANGATRLPGAFNGVGETVAITIAKSTTVRLRVRFHGAGTAPATLYRVQWLMS